MSRLSHNQKKELYKWCILDGSSVQYGKLSLCDLRNFKYSNVFNNRQYQIHCDDNKYNWSKIYDSLESAIEKFIEIQNKIGRIK